MFSTRTARLLTLTAAAGVLIASSACSAEEQPVPAPTPAATQAASTPAGSPSAAPSSAAPTTPSASASSSPAAAGNQALAAAGNLAVREVSDGTVISIESERNGWEVHVVGADGAESQLRTDLAGTAVVSGPTDERPDADDQTENQQFAQMKVDHRDAVDAIEGEIEGGQISELSLDREGTRTLWEADVSVGSESRTVQVDADSGEVVSNRIDD